jgi:hypothetical protein
VKALTPVMVLAVAGGFAAAPANADPDDDVSMPPSSCDGAGCVPSVQHNAAPGAHCLPNTRWDFGMDPASTKTFVCAMWNEWVQTKPLVGVRPEGAPCSGNPGVAQSPEGIPLSCDGQGWRQDYNDIYFKKTS